MTGKIAPHECDEVRLVLGGYKPLATLEKRKQPIMYALATSLAAAGMLVAVYHSSLDSPEGEIIITLRKNKPLISEFLFLLREGVQAFGLKEYHRRMGRLYGYTEEDIEAFIKAEIHCDCSKCCGL